MNIGASRDIEIELVRSFLQRHGAGVVLSTSAKMVDFSGELYNVTGSTEDPKAVRDHKGKSWKELLIRFDESMADASCYVSNVPASPGSTHPKFLVGGHMTPTATGEVPVGGISYLMPICKWHNSTDRDGCAFEHTETRMLKLGGFMERDTVGTFAARLGQEPHSLLYFDRNKGDWVLGSGASAAARSAPVRLHSTTNGDIEPDHEFVLFERRDDHFVIAKTNLL